MISKTIIFMMLVNANVQCTTFEKDGEFGRHEIPVLRKGSITDINNVESVRLINNKMEKIEPGVFNSLPKLTSVTIMANRLTKIEIGVFNGLNLTSLSVIYNKISEIDPHAFDNITTLKFLDLQYNQIVKIYAEWFANKPYLQIIRLNGNSIKEIPANAFGINSRESPQFSIFMDFNPIARIDNDAFKGVSKLLKLHVGVKDFNALHGNFLRNIQVDTLLIEVIDVSIIRIPTDGCLSEQNFSNIFVARNNTLRYFAVEEGCIEDLKEYAKNQHINIKFNQIVFD